MAQIRLFKRRWWFLAVFILITVLLSGCGAPKEYTLSYQYNGEALRELTLTAGELPPEYVPEIPGMRFICWTDQAGAPVEPSAAGSGKDTVYTARVLPALDSHVPYLFADESGFLRPEDSISAEELSQTVSVLLSPEADVQPVLPEGEGPASRAEIVQVLGQFFTDEELAEYAGEGSMSRAEFAAMLNRLTGRGADERVKTEGAAPVDLDRSSPYFADLLEAAVWHSVSAEGTRWEETEISSGYEPGVFLLSGSLYCCGEDGLLLRDAYAGPLYFGADGRYSSGDSELDGYVSETILALCAQHPEAAQDREALLRLIYEYVRDSFQYLSRNHYAEGATEWETDDAKVMFETGLGNCFNSAAAFWALARGIGYPAVTICRPLDALGGVHGWTEIEIDGVPYIFDPQLEKNFKNDRYKLSYEEGRKYGYRRPASPEELVYEDYRDMVYFKPTELGEVVSATGEDGATYLIYLPYGYDENRQYKVLLYLNGADGDPYKMLGTGPSYSHRNIYFGRQINTKTYLDFLIQEGYCDPLIIVSTNTTTSAEHVGRYLSLIQYTVDNFSTYAADSSVEALVEAREHFAIAGPSTAAQSICIAIQELPDIFAYYGLFSGMAQEEATLEAFSRKQEIKYLVMAAGELDYKLNTMREAYPAFSQLDNVTDSTLMIVEDGDHDWTVFDGAIRELLFRFAPAGG